MSFKDKVAIVTGASSGIGAAVAIALAAEGASVAIVGRNEEKLAATAARCANSLAIRADVTVDDDARRIVHQTIENFGKIDILVNNAGCSMPRSIFDENVMEAYDSIMNLNLRAVFRITSLAVPHLIKTKGNILNVSSAAGQSVSLAPELITYAVSKAGLNHFGACLAADLAPYGVRVNTIAPGPVATDILVNSGLPMTWDDFVPATAFGRVAEPKEIADLVLFLTSEKAKSITGSNYLCDSGCLVKRH